MRRIRRHLTFANVASAIALFVAVSGGTAVALSGSNTVQSDDLGPGAQVKQPDIADNAVNSADVVGGSLGLGDLNAVSRPHKLQFGVSGDTAKTTLATMGHLQVSAECAVGVNFPALKVFLKNLSASTGTQNALITMQDGSEGPVALDTSGSFVGAGAEVTIDRTDANNNLGLAGGSFNRAEGQVVFETPGRVTTITFHASTATGLGCQFFGTAVTSNLN
jgi:hypothetical protein